MLASTSVGVVIWLFVVLSALSAFVIAAVAVGSVVSQQGEKARPAVYDLDTAVIFVGDRLPAEMTAVLSYDEVRQVLLWHLDYMQAKGVASYRTDAEVNDELVVVDDDEPVAWILGKADESDLELTDEQVAAVLLQQAEYYRRIGAVGPQVATP